MWKGWWTTREEEHLVRGLGAAVWAWWALVKPLGGPGCLSSTLCPVGGCVQAPLLGPTQVSDWTAPAELFAQLASRAEPLGSLSPAESGGAS